MEIKFLVGAALGLAFQASLAAEFEPAPQHFRQEIAHHFTANEDAPAGPVALLDCSGNGATRVFAAGQWYELQRRPVARERCLEARQRFAVHFRRQQRAAGASAIALAGSSATPPRGRD